MTDHAPGQSASAPAPAEPQSVSDRLRAFTQATIAESDAQSGNPNAWDEEPQEVEAAPQEPTEAPPEEPQQATPTEEMEEVEYGEGKKYQVPVELKRGWLREDDYTRKTQKLAEGRRQIETQLNELNQFGQALRVVAPKVGQLQSLDTQLQAMEREMSDPALEQNDPVRLGALAARYNLLTNQRNRLAQEVSGAHQQYTQELTRHQQQVAAQRLEAEMPILESVVKDFNPDKHGREVSEYLKRAGIAQEAVSFINTSPAALALVWKAKQFDQLQSDKKLAEKKVEKLPPVAKPGQRTSQAEGNVDLKKLRDLNKKTGGKDPEIRRELLRAHLFGK